MWIVEVFGVLIANIFKSCFTLYCKGVLIYLAYKSEIAHVHCSWYFSFASVIYYFWCCGIVSMQWCWWFGMPQLYQCEAYFFLILALFNHLHHSYSAVDSTTCLIMLNMVYIAPLSLIGSVLIVVIPKKYLPPITYRPFSLYIFDASKCLFNIMSYFKYLMISLGWVSM